MVEFTPEILKKLRAKNRYSQSYIADFIQCAVKPIPSPLAWVGSSPVCLWQKLCHAHNLKDLQPLVKHLFT